MQWIYALENDPVFLPDDEKTEYCWLYNLGGLSKKQKADLERASKSYLAVWSKQDCFADQMTLQNPGRANNQAGEINRKGNYAKVVWIIKIAWGKITGLITL